MAVLKNRTQFILILLLITLAFAVRFIHLSGDSLWLDEILTERTALGLMERSKDHPPLLYIVTQWTMQVFGDNAFALRLPSAVMGTLAIPLLIAAATQMGYRQAGLWAALLLALSPFHLHHSQEARHYAYLMTFSLAAFFWLYQLMYRPNWRACLAFALATLLNIYVHYAAFVFLFVQALVIAGWSWGQIKQKQWRQLKYPIAAAILVVLFYIPWLSYFQTGLTRNTGDVFTRLLPPATFIEWIQNTVLALGLGTSVAILAYGMFGFVVVGFWFLIRQQDWQNLLYLLAYVLLPIPLMLVSQINRAALPRYVIYMLPPYLLAVGLAIEWLTQKSRHSLSVVILTTAIIFVIHAPLVGEEYAMMVEDWQGVVEQLAGEAQINDVVVVLSLNAPRGQNIPLWALPTFFEREGYDYFVVPGLDLHLPTALALRESSLNVWAVFTYWKDDLRPTDTTFTLTTYPVGIHVLHNEREQGTALEQVLALYEQIHPFADQPSPDCLFWSDIGYLYLADRQYMKATQALNQSQTICPEFPVHNRPDTRPILAETIYRSIHTFLESNGQIEQARYVEEAWSQGWLTEEDVLYALTMTDLLQRYENGEAVVDDAAAPEPVRVDTFTLPGSSSQDVLFIHPPSQVTYHLTLPAQPVSLHFRTAMFPDSWYWGGDGATFVVTVQPNTGEDVELYRHHVSNQPEDQHWHLANISLAEYAGQTIQLTFHTETGPTGDNIGDWAGWETPRLLWLVEPILP